jgi:hypothetical protein
MNLELNEWDIGIQIKEEKKTYLIPIVSWISKVYKVKKI